MPIICLDYYPPDDAHPYAQGERFKFWVKLEESQYVKIVEQMNKELRELSIWFDSNNKEILRAFIRQ